MCIRDRCAPENLAKTSCGHAHCRLCDGYVDLETRVVAKGPGPILKCCRQPLDKAHYDRLFQETGAVAGPLTQAMRDRLPARTAAERVGGFFGVSLS